MSAVATDAKLQSIESGLEDLKHAYELYFSGQARLEPRDQHAEWRRQLSGVNPAEMSSTSQKFRFVNLKARYNQLHVHWAKICQQIEEGVYKRDKFIAKVHERERAAPRQNQTSAAPTNELKISPKEKKAIDALYKKLVESSGPAAKIPDRASFELKLEKQILHFKEKHPGKGLALKLGKDERGKLQIKLSAKESPKS